MRPFAFEGLFIFTCRIDDDRLCFIYYLWKKSLRIRSKNFPSSLAISVVATIMQDYVDGWQYSGWICTQMPRFFLGNFIPKTLSSCKNADDIPTKAGKFKKSPNVKDSQARINCLGWAKASTIFLAKATLFKLCNTMLFSPVDNFAWEGVCSNHCWNSCSYE